MKTQVMKAARATKPGNRGVLTIALICLGLCSGTLLLALVGTDTSTYFPVVVLLGLTAVPLVSSSIRGDIDLFEPVQILSAIIALDFALRAVYLLVAANLPGYSPLGNALSDDLVPLALWHTILGYIGLLAGYYSIVPGYLVRAFPRLTSNWPSSIRSRPLVVICGIGLLAILIRIHRGEFVGGRLPSEIVVTGDTFVLGALSGFALYAFGIALIYVLRKPAPSRPVYLIAGIAMLSVIAQSFIFGRKMDILSVILYYGTVYNYTRQRVSLSRLFVIGIAVVIMVLPFINVYRSGASILSHGQFVDAVSSVFSYLGEFDGVSYLQFAVVNVMNRSHGIDSLSLIMKLVPDTMGFKYGSDYVMIPAYAFVPRLVWYDKPVDSGGEFGRVFIVDPLEASNSFTSFGMFHIGDLYMNFGLLGILVGMFVLGVIYRSTYDYLAPTRSADPSRLFLYTAILWILMTGFESDISSVSSNLLKTLLFLYAISWFLRSRPQIGAQPAVT